MIFDRLVAYLSGSLMVKVRGVDLEKFINAANKQGIVLKSVKRHGRYLLTSRIAISDYRKLRRLLPASQCKVEIISKHGLPLALSRIRNRRMFFLGLAAAIGILYYLSSFVWFIRVTGNEAISEEAIRQFAENCGIRAGIRKSEVDVSKLEQELIIAFPRIAWVSVKLRGTLLSIALAEKLAPQPAQPEAFDVVAAKSGLVVRFIPLAGEPLIREGDTVEAGQVLVKAIVPEEGEAGEIVSAKAVVEARVWYQASAQVKLIDTEIVRTGRSKTMGYLHILGLAIPIGVPGRGFEQSECEERRAVIQLWSGSRIGMTTTVVTCYETISYPVVRSSDEARAEAIRRARMLALAEVPEEVEVVDEMAAVSFSGEGDSALVRVEYTVETIEDIGVLQATQAQGLPVPNLQPAIPLPARTPADRT